MKAIDPTPRIDIAEKPKLYKAYQNLIALIGVLNQRELPQPLVTQINQLIHNLDNKDTLSKGFKKQITLTQTSILKLVKTEANLVPIGYYRNLYLAIGMAAFGIPFGVAFGAALNNMAFLGIGLPIGMAIGIAIGSAKDKKAKEEGQQLNIHISL